MNRTVVSGIAAFALVIGAALATTETTADAGHCGGGLFARLHVKSCGGGLFSGNLFKHKCGGGLLARLRAKHASNCCAPEPASCEPAAADCHSGCGASTGCTSGCGASTGCTSGCGEVMTEEAGESSSSDAPTEAAPPAPAPDAATDA